MALLTQPQLATVRAMNDKFGLGKILEIFDFADGRFVVRVELDNPLGRQNQKNCNGYVTDYVRDGVVEKQVVIYRNHSRVVGKG
jgi:hypothetical protein